MATAPRVAAASGAASSPSVRGWGGGATQGHSAEHYGGDGFATSFAVGPGWRPAYDDRHGQGYFFFGQYPRKEESEKQPFTPLMALFAAAFPAMTPVNDVRSADPVFISDLIRGVGIYDFNLRAIGGTLHPQGAVLNRYG